MIDSFDDDMLIQLSNRGTFRRARRELDENEFSVTIHTTSDRLEYHWSDPVTCTLPTQGHISQASCTCRVEGVCRHILRSLLYLRETRPAEVDIPWSPADIPYQELLQHFPEHISAAQALLDKGIVAHLATGLYPVARLISENCVVRFSSRNNLKYTQCDCNQPDCLYVPLAVLIFQRFPGRTGFVSTQNEDPLPEQLFQSTEQFLFNLLSPGLRDIDPVSLDQLLHESRRLHQKGLVHHAEILGELREHILLYLQHDARFRPDRLPLLLGEFWARQTALQSPEIPVPRLLVRGQISPPEQGQRRLVGLGCQVQVLQTHVAIQALLVDQLSGRIHTFDHLFPDTDPPLPLHLIGQQRVWSGRSMTQLGAGQLITQPGTDLTNPFLRVDQHTLSVYPQNFRWEDLSTRIRPSSILEFTELLKARPTASLGPRSLSQNHVVLKVRAEHPFFDPIHQTLNATLIDDSGTLPLCFPYLSRAQGFETVLETLHNTPLVFVAGHIQHQHHGLVLVPSALVFESPQGRFMLQPALATPHPAHHTLPTHHTPASHAPDYLHTLNTVLLSGLHTRSLGSELSRNAHQAPPTLAHALLNLAHALETRTQPSQALKHVCTVATLVNDLQAYSSQASDASSSSSPRNS